MKGSHTKIVKGLAESNMTAYTDEVTMIAERHAMLSLINGI